MKTSQVSGLSNDDEEDPMYPSPFNDPAPYDPIDDDDGN